MRRWALVPLLVCACATGAAPRAPAPPGAPALPAPPRPAAAAPPLPELTFRAGGPPRNAVGLTARVASPEIIAARVDGVAALLDPKATVRPQVYEALGAFVTGTGLPPELLQSLDARAPIALVFLMGGLGMKATVCVGATFKDVAGARGAVDRLGAETARTGAVSTRKLPSGKTVHVSLHGRTLFVSTTPGGSALAGPLVEELQAQPPGPLAEVSFFPRVVIPLDGPGLALAARGLADTEIEKDGDLTPPMARAVAAIFVGMAPRAAEVNAARLSLDLDVQGGLALRFALEPVPDSALARALLSHAPHQLDPRVGLASDAAIVGAWSAPTNLVAALQAVAAATGPEGRRYGSDLAALRKVGDGSGTCGVELRPSGMRSLCAWPLLPGVRPADALRRYGAYVRSQRDFTRQFVPGDAPPKLRTAGGVLEIDTGPVRTTPEAEALLRRFMGGEARYLAATVKGDTLFVSMGVRASDARDILASASLPAPVVAPAIAAASARAKAADGIFYLDLAVLMTQVLAVANDPQTRQATAMLRAIPGMADLRVPLELTATTGPSAVYELRVPGSAFESAARLTRPYMGTMGKH